jgi:hypothetical protein
MLVGGVIEKWNVLVDFEGRRCLINSEAVMRSIGKIMHAYPLRLKRLLFLNTAGTSNAPLIAQFTDFVKKFDQDVQVETIGNR